MRNLNSAWGQRSDQTSNLQGVIYWVMHLTVLMSFLNSSAQENVIQKPEMLVKGSFLYRAADCAARSQ